MVLKPIYGYVVSIDKRVYRTCYISSLSLPPIITAILSEAGNSAGGTEIRGVDTFVGS